MRLSIVFLLGLCLAGFIPAAHAQARMTLDIYVVDVEGGNATLFVTPSGESVLIDTGNGGAAAPRDAGRIMAAVKDAGITQIDNLITTHWHGDHFGGMAEFASRITIKNFIDHGPNMQQPNPTAETFLKNVYPELYGKSKHMVAKPGDKLAVPGVDWELVSAAGEVITKPLAGAGQPNPACTETTPNPDDGGLENSMSVGSVVTFGKFRVVHLGDLTQVKEFPLMCPMNRIGTADLWIVSHHGQPMSNSQVLVHAMHPRVAILNNGTRKGGQPAAMKVIFSSPGLEDLWQLHFSLLSGQEYTQPGMFIANMVDDQPDTMPIAPMTAPTPGPGTQPPPQHNGQSYWVKVSAQSDGTFTVTNTRNGFSKTYKAKSAASASGN
jgi:beta-lactamase superfamily II metal-dependent hydrolase